MSSPQLHYFDFSRCTLMDTGDLWIFASAVGLLDMDIMPFTLGGVRTSTLGCGGLFTLDGGVCVSLTGCLTRIALSCPIVCVWHS